MNKMNSSITIGMMVLGGIGVAQASVNDDFESGAFSTDWLNTTVATINAETGNQFASVSPGTRAKTDVLGGYFGDSYSDSHADFSLSFDFRTQETSNRKFAVVIGQENAGNSDGAFINLVCQSTGNIQVYTTAWNSLTVGQGLATGTWHSMTIDGRNFGTVDAEYDVTVNGLTQTGIRLFQNPTPATTQKVVGFNFNAVYGTNPGYDVDNVNAFAVPEPATSALALLGLGGLVGLRRR